MRLPKISVVKVGRGNFSKERSSPRNPFDSRICFDPMKYRAIPKTDLKVSEVGFGVWSLCLNQPDTADERSVHHLLRYALDRGINFFDTADCFRSGRGETWIGDALGEERDRIVIATKFGYDFESMTHPGGKRLPSVSPKWIKRACEESLKRLRTDHIDLYQVHYPEVSMIERDDVYAFLRKLEKQGKILTWGAVLGPEADRIEEGKLLVRLRKAPCLQIPYSPSDSELSLELAREVRQGSGCLIAALPYHGGRLEKAFAREFFGVPRETEWNSPWENFEAEFRTNPAFHGLIQEAQRTLRQAVVKFVLRDPVFVSALADISSEDDINELVLTSERPDLTDKEMESLQSAFQEGGRRKRQREVSS